MPLDVQDVQKGLDSKASRKQPPNVPGSKLIVLGMVIPPLKGILIMRIYTPIIELMTIPYYMEIMGV